ncbi:hypothetical protein KEM55_002128 [Ascosphaera atra]|nr:hypothetical protein KEM55_002128 [Ascosphaera atra]
MGGYPKTGSRGQLDAGVQKFLEDHPEIHLGAANFLEERSLHAQVFGLHALPAAQQATIGSIEFAMIRGPAGTIPIRVLYPESGREKQKAGESAALVYFHGGGYSVGSADEFENPLRILAEESGVQVYAVDYRLSPEWKFPTQLDEYDAVIHWLRGDGGKARGVHPDKILGGGDSAGGNITAGLSIRRRDEGRHPVKAQILLYPLARVPVDTEASVENNTGYYLESAEGNGVFAFADHYLSPGTAPSHPYVSPGMISPEGLKNMPRTAIYTCGFDPYRDVGIEFAAKLEEAGNQVTWRHFDTLTHGFIQLTPWCRGCLMALKEIAADLKTLAYD